MGKHLYKKQLDKRNANHPFTIEDHIRAMVYSMLSAGVAWERMLFYANPETGCIDKVDEIFYNYNPEELCNCDIDELIEKLKKINCFSQYTERQIKALLHTNIKKLMGFKCNVNTIDDYYYSRFISKDSSLKKLITALSDSKNDEKMEQMGIALTCEYLRNVGYDLPKPDRHMCRIFGSEYLGFSNNKNASPFDVIDFINNLKEKTNKSAAEIDYILWSYCANGYGEICTQKNPQCKICKLQNYCAKCNTK